MSETMGGRSFPRGALLGAAALIGFALTAATTSRMTGVGTTAMPPAGILQARELRFEDRADGAVTVWDVEADRMVDVLAPGTNGFVRGALRGLARERRRNELSAQPPFRLILHEGGRLALEDPATGRSIDLEAFGPTNREAFARLLAASGPAS